MRVDHVAQLGLGQGRHAVGRDDDVAADPVGLAREHDRRRAGAQAGLAGGAAGVDTLDQEPVVLGRSKVRATAPVSGTALSPRKAISTLPWWISCAATALRCRSGSRSPARSISPRQAPCGVDPDHLAERVDQRAARVAGVDRGVGLDRAPGRQRIVVRVDVDRVLHRADDAGGRGTRRVEGVADGDDRVADLDEVGVSERQRGEGARMRVDLEHRDAARGVDADHPRAHGLVAREARPRSRAHLPITLLDVRMWPALSITKPEPSGRMADPPGAAPCRRRTDLDDARRVEPVDLARRSGSSASESQQRPSWRPPAS